MASPMARHALSEQQQSAYGSAQDSLDTSNRRVLGDVSPNVRKTSPAAALLTRKPIMGSPLKRSFNASLDRGDGFTYLKKRKLSDFQALSDVDMDHERRYIVAESDLDSQFGPPLRSIDTQRPIPPAMTIASPTEPNTPSDTAESNDDDNDGSSAERKSFSSLINYDPSSQPSAALISSAASTAELLRLRLRVAMYKVRTNQTDVPFADLRLDPAIPTSALRPSTSEAVQEAVAALRREAQQTMLAAAARSAVPTGYAPATPALPTTSHHHPQLLPGPTLRPTAYSSRLVRGPMTNVASSPPGSAAASPERLPVCSSAAATPQRVRQLLPASVVAAATTPDRFRAPAEQELTSSAVKGRVAEGLLGLRNAM